VADTFDALTTERPYRAAVSVEEAAEVLRGERGRQLDPHLVDAFVLSGSEALLERAAEFGASLLECHAFLERFGHLTTRLLARAGASTRSSPAHGAW
jgi:hypothetical protein